MLQNYINHIVFVVDNSGSMSHLSDTTVEVFDKQIKFLAHRSKELNQETRASVYLFGESVKCLIYDMDVMRVPSLRGYYKADEPYTALLDATLKSVEDLKKTPELYGDHSFLIYVLTDGQNNVNNYLATRVAKELNSLPNNWTAAVLVPDQSGVYEAKKFGFPAQNIQVWSTTKDGIKEVGDVMTKATENFMQARSTGQRSTKSLFNLDISNLSSKVVKQALQELGSKDYELFPVAFRKPKMPIKDYVESWTKEDYRKGSAYYQITKPETIQGYKQICIQDKLNGKVYTGLNARSLLGLPNHEIKVTPADYGKYDIFVQSTSTNRLLVNGTKLIVMK